jgi:diadenylate cyclase
VRETVKELAQLDGGFVVSGTGTVISAARYFVASLQDIEPVLGLGTGTSRRRRSAHRPRPSASWLSESSVVRVYDAGTLAAEILPEAWLLHRFVSHVSAPRAVAHRSENIGVVSRSPEA